MKRLTTDCATDNLEVMMNYVFVRDGWAHIVSDGERENVPLTTWAKEQCIKRGCDEFPGETPEEIDETLCDCLADGDGCPVALAYCFASQACHLRGRLKQYEDTGKDPTGNLDRSRWEGCKHCDEESNDYDKREICVNVGDFTLCEDFDCMGCEFFQPAKYCRRCGRPLNEEAWAELERRINGGTTDMDI